MQATDADGDTVTATGTVSVVVDDDTPAAVAGTSTGTVDEDGLLDGIAGGIDDVGRRRRLVATGSVTGLFQSGADVPLSYGFNTGGTLPAGLTSGGVALSYIITADLITATAGAGGADGVHDGARRGDRCVDVHAVGAARPSDGGADTENDLPSSLAAWCRRPTGTATR